MTDYESSDGECEGVELAEGFRITALKEDGVVFKVNTNVDEALEESRSHYFDEEILNNLNSECLGGESDDDDEGDRHLMPFERIALKMFDITEDGKLKKRIIRKGVGAEPPDGSMVYYHYNGYLEYSDEPYDSTYLRGRPVRDLLGRERFIIGLDKGLFTMKRGEISEFLIDPDLAFGKMGCPPRIPRDARVLMRVELLKFTETPEDIDPGEIGNEVKTFQQQYKHAEACHILGNELFKKKDVNSAVVKYKKAVTTLQKMRLADENEQEKQQMLLHRCYLNLAICYNAQKKHPRACEFCRLVLDANPTHTKALFHYARALVALGDYTQARIFLLRAQRQDRTNPEINRELAALDTKISKYNADMTDMSRKMFAMPKISKENDKECDKEEKEGETFEAEARACLTSFLEDKSMNELPLPEGLTGEEEAIFKQEAEAMNLLWKSRVLGGQKKISVVKVT